jgi:uridine kinase
MPQQPVIQRRTTMPRLILIAGGTASGKSTIAANLKNRLSEYSVAVFSHDHYYKDLSHLSAREHEEYNFDHPDAIDSKALSDNLKVLLKGRSINIPVYDYSTYTRSQKKAHIAASEIIIIEGIFALYYKELAGIADLKIYVDTDTDIRLKRRIDRDTSHRGYTVSEVIERYNTTVKPMHDLYVEPARNTADMVVNGNDDVNIICDEIMRILLNILR